VTAEIDAGVSMTDSDRRVAVTTTSLRVESLAVADGGEAESCVHPACAPSPSDKAHSHPAAANRRVESVLETIGNSSQFFHDYFFCLQYDEYDFIYH
jgi:hypothetical protein